MFNSSTLIFWGMKLKEKPSEGLFVPVSTSLSPELETLLVLRRQAHLGPEVASIDLIQNQCAVDFGVHSRRKEVSYTLRCSSFPVFRRAPEANIMHRRATHHAMHACPFTLFQMYLYIRTFYPR